MNAKKIFGFLFCSSAFTKRNISSVGLVGIFFLVYILAGGRIETKLPSAATAGMFGSADALRNESSKQILGIAPTQNRATREQSGLERGRIFTNDDAEQDANDQIDKDGLIKGQERVFNTERERRETEKNERYKRDEVDPFAALEERLKKSGR